MPRKRFTKTAIFQGFDDSCTWGTLIHHNETGAVGTILCLRYPDMRCIRHVFAVCHSMVKAPHVCFHVCQFLFLKFVIQYRLVLPLSSHHHCTQSSASPGCRNSLHSYHGGTNAVLERVKCNCSNSLFFVPLLHSFHGSFIGAALFVLVVVTFSSSLINIILSLLRCGHLKVRDKGLSVPLNTIIVHQNRGLIIWGNSDRLAVRIHGSVSKDTCQRW